MNLRSGWLLSSRVKPQRERAEGLGILIFARRAIADIALAPEGDIVRGDREVASWFTANV